MKIRKIMLWILVLLISGFLVYYYYPETKLPENTTVDHLVVYKSKRQLLAFSEGKLLKVYKISLGKNPIGHKEFEGDNKTPEGIYYIEDRNPKSGYHKNLGISYPNEQDKEKAKKAGKPSGGDIKIHGIRNGAGYINKIQRWSDWTAGCIALTNSEIDELYQAVKIGSKIEIYP
ncbi:L,D-transpeptidase family protein [Flavobacterium sp. '19STA2R22 D10 B1']|uniref:L,D-transpeptidase family protein n=1 Tax=Flavobacterium aerium TaxID=3037261 RepID=UPI00278C46D4|nr:L,D-transpeptidase family protein [Flavobacterium sp. '19STA2R22 D10 B1']